jgi:hypothetical protein|nr:MAG TPA: PlyB like endolysin [Caudoviricetes sp.]
MQKGIDVSENNGVVDWQAVKDAGIEFAIIRIGYGKFNLDSRFVENVNGALDAGLKVGVYHYSYALSEDMAGVEARFVADTIFDCGLENSLEMGVWFDMEDADGYKERHGVTDRQELTNMCSVFINRMREEGFDYVGLYANYDWLTNVLYMDQLDVAVWIAQYNFTCDYDEADIWQCTDSLEIDGKYFDGNVIL